jgi:hypothetical protein
VPQFVRMAELNAEMERIRASLAAAPPAPPPPQPVAKVSLL